MKTSSSPTTSCTGCISTASVMTTMTLNKSDPDAWNCARQASTPAATLLVSSSVCLPVKMIDSETSSKSTVGVCRTRAVDANETAEKIDTGRYVDGDDVEGVFGGRSPRPRMRVAPNVWTDANSVNGMDVRALKAKQRWRGWHDDGDGTSVGVAFANTVQRKTYERIVRMVLMKRSGLVRFVRGMRQQQRLRNLRMFFFSICVNFGNTGE